MSFVTAVKNDYKLVVLVLMTFLVMTLASYQFVSQVIKKQIDLQSQTEMLVYRNSLTSFSRACEDALIHSAQVMSMALDRGVKADSQADLVKRLSKAFSTQGNLRDFFRSSYCYLDGNYIDIDGLTAIPKSQMEEKEWYFGALDNSDAHVAAQVSPQSIFHSSPYMDKETGRPIISLSMPISDSHGVVHGVMGMEVRLDPVIRRVEALKSGTGGVFALLADSSLRVLVYRNSSEIGKKLSELAGFDEIAPYIPYSRGDILIKRIQLQDAEYVAIFSRLENGWLLGIFSPVSFYYQKAFDSFPVVLGLALVLAIMLTIVLMRLSQAKIRSEEANRLKNSSLARISHELRTPLNAVIGLSELARRDLGGPNTKGYLEDISRAGGTLLNLVNDILDFSKMESGKFDLTESPYRVSRLFSDVLALISVRLRDKPFLEFHSDISPHLPVSLLGDEKSVRQVLLNLLVNAVKYTNQGFIKFTADFVSLDHSMVELVFIIEDSGVGILEEDLEHLFDDFVRLEGRYNTKVEGTGLGLPIARSLCRMMNGDISVESVFGQGSKFTATCRQTVLDPRPMGHLPLKSTGLKSQESVPFLAPGFKVLLVDDVRTNLTVVSGLLEPYHMEVTTALSGPEALKLTKADKYDLLFIDQMMPELDGVETMKQMRLISGHYLRAPIVCLTANAVTGARESLLEKGFDDYLSKPIEIEELTNLLEKWVPAWAKVPVPKETFGQPETSGPEEGHLLKANSASDGP
ncbi:MAG: response regulator, partial [Deltaproteobacteria bacterium]|nr:response regulator [Deltaproteobacteria bacterium]